MKDETIKKLNSLVDLIAEEILESGMNASELKKFGKYLTPTRNISKAEYAKALAWALCTPSKFIDYYESFDAAGKEIFQKLAFSTGIAKSVAIFKILKKIEFSKYYDDDSKLPFAFILNYSYSNFIVLPAAIKKCACLQLQDYLQSQSEVAAEISDEEFKKSTGYFSADDGLAFFLNLQHTIQLLKDINFFSREPSEPILKGTLQKVSKIADFKSFAAGQKFSIDNYPDYLKQELDFPKAASERTETARLSLALSFLSLAYPVNNADKNSVSADEFSDPKVFYRNLLNNFFQAQTTLLDEKCLYPHISIHTSFISTNLNKFRSFSLRKLISLIKKFSPDRPQRFTSYLSLLDEKELPFFYPYESIDSTVKFFYGSQGYSDSIYINPIREYINSESKYKFFVQEAAYNNLFLMLASIGLFEITWLPPCEEPKNKADIIQWYNDLTFFRNGKIGFIKITELGKYAFGITDDFAVSSLKQFAPPRLDENSLIIHIDDGDKSMQIFLDSFCVQLSRTLYKADELRMKRICKSKEAVNSIFKTLSSRTNGKIPKIWEDLKNSIIESFVTLTGEYDWVVFSLEKQSEGLIRCIEKLSRQGICLKMEGKRVAVNENNLSLFEKRIEAEGFKLNS